VLQFVCDVVKDTCKEEYQRPFIRIGLDWVCVCVCVCVGVCAAEQGVDGAAGAAE